MLFMSFSMGTVMVHIHPPFCIKKTQTKTFLENLLQSQKTSSLNTASLCSHAFPSPSQLQFVNYLNVDGF